MELHEYNAAALKMITDSLFPRSVAEENEELHDRDEQVRSAADDLLYASRLALEDLEDWTGIMGPLDPEEHRQTFDAIEALQAAIAKADGR